MGTGLRSGMGFASLVLIAGSIVLMLFVVLSGVTDTVPLNKTYFLQADTSKIAGARPVTQWTYFYICGADNLGCGAPVPDLPFGYAWLGGGSGAPAELAGSHGKSTTTRHFYFLWRFGWVFYIIALAANVASFFTCLLAPFSRLASAISGFLVANALFWFSVAAPLMTAEFVQARNAFISNGQSAHIGRYAFGFTWGAWACMFLATLFLSVGCCSGGSSSRESKRTSKASSTNKKTGFFRRERGSFIDNDSQRRVKDEYA